MDREIRWLRRYVLWTVFRRLALEATVAAMAVTALAVVFDFSWPTALALAAIAAHSMAIGRLTLALHAGPTDVRYLVTWENTAFDLRSIPSEGPVEFGEEESLDGTGFRFLTALRWDDHARGDALDSAMEGYDVYGIDSDVALLCVALDDEPMVLLSELADGTLLLTTTEMVPPSSSLLVNRSESMAVGGLVADHADAIDELRANDRPLKTIGPDAVPRYLAAEWTAWDQIGPFLGSLLRVGNDRNPVSLDVAMPFGQLWRRTARRSSGQGTVASDPTLDGPRTSAPVPTIAPPPTPETPQTVPTAPVRSPDQDPAPTRVYPAGTPPPWTTKQRPATRPINSPT